MCSVIIWIRDDTGGPLHPEKMAQRPQRGHVVDVNERDDFFWGHSVPDHAIVVRVPGVPVASLKSLVMGREETPEHYAQFKANTIDVDALLAKCPEQDGITTYMERDKPYWQDGKMEWTLKRVEVPARFSVADLPTLLACRRTLAPAQREDVL